MAPQRGTNGPATGLFRRNSGCYNQPVEFRILGPLEALDGSTPVRLGGRNQRALLALLLLNGSDVVSTDRLIDGLWGEEPPRTAPTSLQNAVSQLRKLLGADRVVTKAPGYFIRLEQDELDTARVLGLVAIARTADTETRVACLREAESLWHGPPLADFAFDAFAQSAIARLEELRLNVIEERIDAELELGRHADAVSELEALLAESPLRERLRSQLMVALYRSGRQADALRVYQEGRRVLVDELGIDPSPSLQRLHGAILRQDRRLDPIIVEPTAEESIEGIAIALLEGRLVPVLGTEVGELAHRLAERFRFPADSGTELTRVAEYVALMKGSGPLYDELHELLSARAAPTSIHRSLASLAPVLRERGAGHQLLVTTGYDLALEQAFLDAGEEFDVVSYLASGRDGGKFCHFAPDGTVHVVDVPNRYATELDIGRRTVILKLHGSVDPGPERAWESFVVTEDDYLDYLPESDLATAIPVALAAHLRRSHFLFLGYAMQDWNLRLVLNRFWGVSTLSFRSWAVAPGMPSLERALWRRRDVDVLNIALEDFVDSLVRRAVTEVEAAR
jgi:DNA-binding SARP family transcriptional activator